jgi:hypothetical protein
MAASAALLLAANACAPGIPHSGAGPVALPAPSRAW